ncbi:hypothetical protein SprV_0200559100 [Sparganum proliferum]
MRQARDRQRESIALSGSNPGKSVANIFRHRSSSKRGHELSPLLNDNKVFLTDDTDKAELFSDFFAKHLATESDPVPFVRSPSDRTLSTIDVSSDLIKKHINSYFHRIFQSTGPSEFKLPSSPSFTTRDLPSASRSCHYPILWLVHKNIPPKSTEEVSAELGGIVREIVFATTFLPKLSTSYVDRPKYSFPPTLPYYQSATCIICLTHKDVKAPLFSELFA